jgi:hypothetical protein
MQSTSRAKASNLKAAAPEDYGVFCPDGPVVVDCDKASGWTCVQLNFTVYLYI